MTGLVVRTNKTETRDKECKAEKYQQFF